MPSPHLRARTSTSSPVPGAGSSLLRTTAAALGAVALLAGCAAGDQIDPAGTGPTGPGSGGGNGTSSGSGGQGGAGATTTSTASTSSTTSTSSAPDTTSVGPGGGDGGGDTTSVGPGGGDGGAGTGGAGGQGGSGVPVCGNGVLEAGETCDGDQLDDATCTSIGQGFEGGTLACGDDCELDTSGCTAPTDCGNGVIEAGEDCDGAQLGGATCATEGFASGTISCSGGCVLDTSACWTCGDGAVTGSELCDGANLDGFDCLDLGHDGGTLSCAANCLSFSQTACSDCGDGQVEAPEACDGNNFAGATCASSGFDGGSLLCTGACSTISTANCYDCGDGVIEGAEVCDGAALGGQTCVGLGFEVGGTLACAGNCLGFNTAQCVDSECNDGFDNDGDGFVDLGDVGCTSGVDASEAVYANNCSGLGAPIYDITISDTEVNYAYTGSAFDSTAAPSDFQGSCRNSDGRELIYVYRSPIAQPWIVFSTDHAATGSFDTVLYVRRGSCTAAEAACNDDIDFLTYSSEVQINNVAANELLFVFVDAYANGAGAPFGLVVYPASAND